MKASVLYKQRAHVFLKLAQIFRTRSPEGSHRLLNELDEEHWALQRSFDAPTGNGVGLNAQIQEAKSLGCMYMYLLSAVLERHHARRLTRRFLRGRVNELRNSAADLLRMDREAEAGQGKEDDVEMYAWM